MNVINFFQNIIKSDLFAHHQEQEALEELEEEAGHDD